MINVHRPYHQSRRCRVPVTLITAADGVCHPTSAALIIGRQRRRSIYPDRGRADRERTNKNNNRDREIGPLQSATALSDRRRAGGRARLVAATGGDSAGVSQTGAGRPWAAAAAAWLVIHGVAAGMRRESQRKLWDIRYTAIHSWVGTIGILVEGGWSGRWSDGRRSGGMSPLIG